MSTTAAPHWTEFFEGYSIEGHTADGVSVMYWVQEDGLRVYCKSRQQAIRGISNHLKKKAAKMLGVRYTRSEQQGYL